MTVPDQGKLAPARRLRTALHALQRVATPPRLLPSILSRVGLADAYASIETGLGMVFVAYSTRGISAVMRADDPEAFERAFQQRFGRPVRAAEEEPATLRRAVLEQLAGRPHPELRYDLRALTEFEQAVLRKALEIPRGEVRPYAWVAREIGRPKAVRAVGTALARNPVPLLIPCHRVVRSDGSVGKYAFGASSKRAILTAEGAHLDEIERLARAGVRFIGSATTHVYCFPSCRYARRIGPARRQPFRSTAAAGAAGYRPCKACRPLALAVGA